MTLFIQGLAIPLGIKNLNDWGVPESEADNVLNSLKASSLKVCPGEAHLCDFSQDPYGRIGHVIDAWREADGIHAKAEVTDSVAARKIKEGTWKDFKWSTFADSKTDPTKNEGWAGGVTVKSMTLVRNPAWEQAQYQITASADDTFTELRLFSDFSLIASGDDHIPTDDELKAAQTKIADMQKEIDTLTQSATVSASTIEKQKTKITKLEASIVEKDKSLNVAVNDVTEAKTSLEKATEENGKLTASVNDLNTKLDEKTTLVASLEMEKARSVPMKEINTMIAAAIEQHDLDLKAANERDEAFKMFASARESLGLETKPENYTTLSAADLTTLAQEFGAVKVSAAQIRYPADNSGSSGFTVGRPDGKGGWVV